MTAQGRLRVCATPIGNLGDVTLRVLDALREADVIVAEDTRVTRRLLSRYEISTPVMRYDEHVANERTPALVQRILGGEVIALVSDAGTPAISDPGTRLVEACVEAGASVEVLPGPSAILAALVSSGLPTGAFYFGGFLPRKHKQRLSVLTTLADLDATLIFYESPRRAGASLTAMAEALPGRACALARELTKIHEEIIRGTVEQVGAEIENRADLKGEVVLLVGPPRGEEKHTPIDEERVRVRFGELSSAGMSSRDAVRQVSDELGVPRNTVYDIAHAHRPHQTRATSS